MEEAKRYKTEAAQRDAFVKICHDMRTPLSSVMHLAQILEIEADRPDRVRERAAEIAVSAEYLLGLADDIVDIYKLGGGRIDIKKEPFSPYELAEDIQKILCPQIKDAGHELAVCIAEAVPDMLLGDKRRLERILLNLIANSVQHTAAGGKTVLCISCAQGDRVEKLPLVGIHRERQRRGNGAEHFRCGACRRGDARRRSGYSHSKGAYGAYGRQYCGKKRQGKGNCVSRRAGIR